MKTTIHVNRHVIKSNCQSGACEPPITVSTYKGTRRGRSVRILKDGVEVGRFVYSPDRPLKCGAKLWATFSGCEVVVE